jgi:hypothetical protein
MSSNGAQGAHTTPQERLAKYERDARLKVLVLSFICCAALFIEFLLAVTLPVKVGFDTFLSFTRSPTVAVNPAFQLGLCVGVTLLGIVVCVLGIVSNQLKFMRSACFSWRARGCTVLSDASGCCLRYATPASCCKDWSHTQSSTCRCS